MTTLCNFADKLFQFDIDWLGLLFALVIIIFVIWILRASRKRGNTFDAVDLLVDREGRADKYALGYLLVLLVSTWSTWYLTVHDRLTDWFYTAYVGAFVIGALGKTWAMVNKDNAAQPTTPATPPPPTDPK